MGILDNIRGRREEDLSDGDYTARGYEARAGEERSKLRKEKLKEIGASTIQSIKKGAETTKTGIEKTRAWAQEQEKKKKTRSPPRGTSKRTTKKTTKKTTKRASRDRSISEELDPFGGGERAQGGDPFGGGDIFGFPGRKKKGGGPLIPF